MVADGPSHPAYKAYLRDRMPESTATYSRLAAPYFQLPRPITPEHRPRNFSMERPPVPNHGLPSTSPLTSPNSSFIQSPRPRLAVEKSKLLDHLHSRVSSPEATAPDPCGNSTDDSERAVERMLGSRPTTSTPATPPSKAGATLESSPGYAWKRTVLLPTNSGASWGFNATSSNIPSASTQVSCNNSHYRIRPTTVKRPLDPAFNLSTSTLPSTATIPPSLNHAIWDHSDTDSP